MGRLWRLVLADADTLDQRGSASAGLIREALADGPPGPVDLAVHLGIWLLPERIRRWIAERFAVRHETRAAPGL